LAGAFLATAFFLAGAFLATAFFLAGAFLATAFFLVGAFLAAAFFLTGAFLAADFRLAMVMFFLLNVPTANAVTNWAREAIRLHRSVLPLILALANHLVEALMGLMGVMTKQII
jgi:hypothetical protein